jgi:hypothetical protein
MARPKRSIYSEEERASRRAAKKKRKAIAKDFEAKRPEKSFDKYEERKQSDDRRKRKREDEEKKGGFKVLDHGEKAAACKKYVIKDCDRTADLARKEGRDPHRGVARRSAYKSGRVKECREMIAPDGGYVACQKKTTGKGHRLINKTRVGSVTKVKSSGRSRKKKKAVDIGPVKRDSLLSGLESKVTKKLAGPRKRKRIELSMRRMSKTKKPAAPKKRKPALMFRARFENFNEEMKHG